MRRWNWLIILGGSLLLLSVIFYLIHYLIFKDSHHIFIYMVGDIAFVFIEVLLVTLIIHRVLEEREKRARLEKLNMVIGVFFAEVGTELLRSLSWLDPKMEKKQSELDLGDKWTQQEFTRVSRWLRTYDHEIDPEKVNWDILQTFLEERRDFLLRLLENPNLRAAIGERARQVAEVRFNWVRLTDQLETFYQRIVGHDSLLHGTGRSQI